MLDPQTKQRINNARQVLVGNVPTPEAQIDQITTALIYKFMDDMDRENESIGELAIYFTGELAQFSWGKLISKRLSGDARWQLYTDATARFAKSKQIPALFRTIFKNAYLPYRDSRVLNLFLTEINGFSYEHSEKLGDAFEYLLSISGAQSAAGQFRTPRHIIDFIVEIINPQKNERILDPACGTAGFLISAYKHILKHNSTDQTSRGDKLTPDERKALATNIHGYDIAPEMVRLSLVNLYLHGFINPQIIDYDTLTSDTNWGDDYDVILANPPFMTPKGGIIPHDRFSVQARRAEVLFVDYIAEHLSARGKAGIIVPEGIIFQAANAYKQLRQNLVQNWGLYCVISLPAGVFQPYSGVKTSILLLDKTQSKNSNILFVNIQNDGFDLGAKRHKIDNNDLPLAHQTIKNWQQSQTINQDNPIAISVAKTKIAKDGEYNLSANRYQKVVDYSNAKWDMVALGEVCEILDNKRKPVKKSDRKQGKYPYYGATGILDYIDSYIFNERLVLIGEDGAKWGIGDKTAFIANGKYWVNNHAHVLRPNKDKLLDTLLVEIINSIDLTRHITGITVPKLNQAKLKQIKIPLPPLKIQQQIVTEIEAEQKAIAECKKLIASQKQKIKAKMDEVWAIK